MDQPKQLSFSFLIEAAKRMKVTEEDVQRVEKRLKEYDKVLEKEGKVTTEFLNRTYGI